MENKPGKNIKQKMKKTVNCMFLTIIACFNDIFSITNRGVDKFRIKVMKFLKYENYENEYGFEDLMPQINVENSNGYCKSLDWALKNDKIKNIALTGIYGAGKSSILQTYAELHREYKYLNISLASFKIQEDNDNELLEKGILKQMFYKVKYKKIPYSRFKKIKTMGIIPIFFKIFALISIGSIWGILFYPNLLNEIKERLQTISDLFKISGQTVIAILGVLAISTLVIVAHFIRYCNSNLKIKKVKIKDGEAEIGEESEKSIFNKYIDEIVYFFEATKYDIVIFEDLDRFNNIEVFSNLRDLNILLNNSEQVHRRIVFIYAIKDEMFSNTDKESTNYKKDDNVSNKNRTKFFDFIIPVIPIANSANSCDILINKLKEFKQWEGLNEEFISDITFLINDMRILKNIYNEFVIYKSNLEHDREQNSFNEVTNKLDVIKLLAIIVYKNIYPSDFDKLQIDEGMVYEVFNNDKYQFIKSRIEEINKRCIELDEEIRISERECLDNIKELRTVCLAPLMEINHGDSIAIGSTYNIYKISDLQQNDEMFLVFLQQNDNKYFYKYNSSWYQIDDSYKKEIMNRKENYKRREHLLKLKEKNITTNIIDYLRNELECLNNEKEVLSSLPLQNILKDNSNKALFSDDIKNEKLLLFLIRNGHIDEDYSRYISYFYEGTLTKKDDNFLHAIKYQEGLDFNYQLEKIEAVIKKISTHEFKNKYVLNYMLLDYIIINKEEKENYELYYDFIIEQLAKENDYSFKFIRGYINRGNNLSEFIKTLCNKWHGIWKWIQIKSNMDESNIKLYLKYILEDVDIEDLKEINKDLILEKYIAKMKDFLYIFNDEIYNDKIKNVLNVLNIKFEELIAFDDADDLTSKMFGQWSPNNVYGDLNNELFEYLENNNSIQGNEYNKKLLTWIYENNSYEINPIMIITILNKFSDKSNIKKISYTTIINSGCKKMEKYINENIQKYVTEVLLKSSEIIEETEEAVKIIINNEKIDDSVKALIIEKLKFEIQDITKVEADSLWSIIIINNKCTISWINVINYYIKLGKIDNILIEYLNKLNTYSELAKVKLEVFYDKFEEKVFKDITEEIIRCEKLGPKSFENIARSISYTYSNFEVKDLSVKRAEELIKYNLISFTKENYENIRGYYEKNYIHIMLIEKNINKYLEEQEKYIVDAEDLNSLLKANVITEDQKLDIIRNMNVDIIENDISLIENTIKLIMQGYFDMDLINKLSDIVIRYELNKQLDIKVLDYILNNECNSENKIRILTSQIKYLSRKQIFDKLLIIGEPYSNISEYNKRPSLAKTGVNEEFIKEMDDRKKISSFKIEGDKIKVVNLQKKFKE